MAGVVYPLDKEDLVLLSVKSQYLLHLSKKLLLLPYIYKILKISRNDNPHFWRRGPGLLYEFKTPDL